MASIIDALNHALIYPRKSSLLANLTKITMSYPSLNGKTAIQAALLQL
jgi:hypothetical protein